MAATPSGVVRWGVFEFDPSTGTLSKHGREVRLPEQPTVALRLLVARAGELVSRDELRAALWADGTFVDFENGINVAINRVRDVLGDSASSPRFIETVPRRGYRFIAPVSLPVARSRGAVPDHREPRRPRRRAAWLVAAAVVLALLGMVAARRSPPSSSNARGSPGPVAAPRFTRLTAFSGVESCPALSPDGEQVAFSWSPTLGEPQHLFVTLIGSADKRQITSGEGSDSHAAWSSDGRFIAFIRDRPGESRLYIVSALGGTARRVGEFPGGGQFAWSPGDRYLLSGRSEGADRGIWAVPAAGGAPRLLVPAPVSGGARAVALSPDGRRMAYASCRNVSDYGYQDCDGNVVSLDASLMPTGPPERLVTMPTLGGFAWTRRGTALVFFGDLQGTGESRLCRVDVKSRALETIDAAGIDVGIPTTARANDRLVFVRFDVDVDIVAARAGHAPVPVVTSSADDGMPDYAPDGRRIVFTSGRTGPREIWIADASGDNPRQLTYGPGPSQEAAKWSPDGRTVAFMSRAADGHMHVWSVGSDGGSLRQLTAGVGDEGTPTWSVDGQFVYFGASRGQGYDIWRVPAGGGPPQRITTGGSGYSAFESPDGRTLLYQQKTEPSALLLKPSAGGAPTMLVTCAEGGAFTWQRTGIYYVPCGSAPDVPVHRMSPASHHDAVVLTLHDPVRWRQRELAISPDGGTVLYVRQVAEGHGSDLWMIDPFE